MIRIKQAHVLKSPVDEGILNHRIHPVINSVERYARMKRGEVN